MTAHPAGHVGDNRLAADQAGGLMRLATYASVTVAVTLIGAKSVAWLATDSVSMLSTLVDSLLDGLASLISLLAVHRALQPADHEHRFGHGKAEPLAGLAQSAFISGSAVFLVIQASGRFFSPRNVENTDIGLLVMVLAIVLTAVLVLFQRYVVRKTGSTAIQADSLHYQTDLMVNASVIVSLFLAMWLGWQWADPLFAMLIAGYILHGAWGIGRNAFEILMDRELPEQDRDRIRTLALSHPEVLGLHDMRTRSSGPQSFIQLHLEMDGDMTLRHSHQVVDQVVEQLEAAFPDAEIIIHQDPPDIDEKRTFVE